MWLLTTFATQITRSNPYSYRCVQSTLTSTWWALLYLNDCLVHCMLCWVNLRTTSRLAWLLQSIVGENHDLATVEKSTFGPYYARIAKEIISHLHIMKTTKTTTAKLALEHNWDKLACYFTTQSATTARTSVVSVVDCTSSQLREERTCLVQVWASAYMAMARNAYLIGIFKVGFMYIFSRLPQIFRKTAVANPGRDEMVGCGIVRIFIPGSSC